MFKTKGPSRQGSLKLMFIGKFRTELGSNNFV